MAVSVRPQTLRTASTALTIGREVILIVAAILAYFGVRGLTEGGQDLALANAELVIEWERALGIFWEPSLQRLIHEHHGLVSLVNWIYIYGHWPVVIVTGIWLWVRHRSTYTLVRNAMFISGGIGIVLFALFPVAPPRLTDLPVMDTVTQYSRAYRVLQPPALTNQFAAMPSLHFGWNLLIGIMLVRTAPASSVRLFGWLMPALMACAVVLTANHYILDVVAGGALALLGLFLAWRLQLVRNRRAASQS